MERVDFDRLADVFIGSWGFRALVFHGSQVYGDALPESDVDVFAVVDTAQEATSVRRPVVVAGAKLLLDIKTTSPQGAITSHARSPDWRVAFFSGIRYGDWSFLPIQEPLSAQAAKVYLDDVVFELALSRWLRSTQDTVGVLRSLLTLESALQGGAATPASWGRIADTLGISHEAMVALCRGDAGVESRLNVLGVVKRKAGVVQELVSMYSSRSHQQVVGADRASVVQPLRMPPPPMEGRPVSV